MWQKRLRRTARNLLQEVERKQTRGRIRGAIDFAVDGDIRFISHREMMRVFARACARAGLPVRRTEGFNPRPRIMLPLPRPVGISSDAERVVIELTEPLAAESLIDLLAPQMPTGIEMRGARMLDPLDRCVPRLVRYSVATEGLHQAVLASRASGLLGSASIRYDRYVHKAGRHIRVDLRPFIESIEVAEKQVRFALHVTGDGSAKPAEICEVLGIGKQLNHLIRRTEVVWQRSLR